MGNQLATPLHDWHVAQGGRMVDFAGWSMPVQYTSIVAEHTATRTAAGLFDISHMGRLRFDGAGAAAFLDALVTRSVGNLKPGVVRYSLMTNEQGGILDDVLVYHLADSAGGSYYLLVVNAGNREKIIHWIDEHRSQAGDCTYADLTCQWAMIAVQGPSALALLQPLVEFDLASMKYYTGVETRIAGHGGIVSRTGYTGEDGCELILGNAAVQRVWEALLEAGRPKGVLPAGLGCRDTLRLEAAMPLYGHELTEESNPYQAGLGFAVNLDKGDFPGRDVLARLAGDPNQPRRIGMELSGKRVPREGHAIQHAGERVGYVTSGTFSPTFERPIAMGYVRPDAAVDGTVVEIDIRGRLETAHIVALPFYSR
jgi:aminomethyltransferase